MYYDPADLDPRYRKPPYDGDPRYDYHTYGTSPHDDQYFTYDETEQDRQARGFVRDSRIPYDPLLDPGRRDVRPRTNAELRTDPAILMLGNLPGSEGFTQSTSEKASELMDKAKAFYQRHKPWFWAAAALAIYKYDQKTGNIRNLLK